MRFMKEKLAYDFQLYCSAGVPPALWKASRPWSPR